MLSKQSNISTSTLNYWLISLIALIASASTATAMCAAHGVATSANKIANVAVFYFCPDSSTLHDSEGDNMFVV